MERQNPSCNKLHRYKKNFTKPRLYFLLTGPKTVGYIEAIRIDNQTSLSENRSFSCTIAKNKIEKGPWLLEIQYPVTGKP